MLLLQLGSPLILLPTFNRLVMGYYFAGCRQTCYGKSGPQHCVCACVRACVRARACACVRACVRACVYARVRVCGCRKRERACGWISVFILSQRVLKSVYMYTWWTDAATNSANEETGGGGGGGR